MAKNETHDTQILATILREQHLLRSAISSYQYMREKNAPEKCILLEAITYKILRIWHLTKGMTTKLAKNLKFFNKFQLTQIENSWTVCYPVVSAEDIIGVAQVISDAEASGVVEELYTQLTDSES